MKRVCYELAGWIQAIIAGLILSLSIYFFTTGRFKYGLIEAVLFLPPAFFSAQSFFRSAMAKKEIS